MTLNEEKPYRKRPRPRKMKPISVDPFCDPELEMLIEAKEPNITPSGRSPRSFIKQNKQNKTQQNSNKMYSMYNQNIESKKLMDPTNSRNIQKQVFKEESNIAINNTNQNILDQFDNNSIIQNSFIIDSPTEEKNYFYDGDDFIYSDDSKEEIPTKINVFKGNDRINQKFPIPIDHNDKREGNDDDEGESIPTLDCSTNSKQESQSAIQNNSHSMSEIKNNDENSISNNDYYYEYEYEYDFDVDNISKNNDKFQNKNDHSIDYFSDYDKTNKFKEDNDYYSDDDDLTDDYIGENNIRNSNIQNENSNIYINDVNQNDSINESRNANYNESLSSNGNRIETGVYQIHSINHLYSVIKSRIDSLIKTGKKHFPATKNTQEVILRLIDQSRACHEYHFLENRVKYFEKENTELKLNRADMPKKYSIMQQKEVKQLSKELVEAKNRIEALQVINRQQNLSNRDPNHLLDEVEIMKKEHQVIMSKEKQKVEKIRISVNYLQKQLDEIEKRISLMTQKTSNYSVKQIIKHEKMRQKEKNEEMRNEMSSLLESYD
ncbi:hypothetical protein M9Y10_005607 [Tritrichomonas musculus]|uniref:Uncharacterized protein n=1 Tax=Tritrichomonas musculus TaxID=1915356 RepID=A0ABR2JC66_9EUKA